MQKIQKYSNKKGFTLAEVLITLTVIGVIAALTIPALLQNINEQDLRTQWKAAYSICEQATKKALVDSGSDFTGVFQNTSDMKDKLKYYFNYTRECTSGQSSGNCWPSQTFHKDNNPSGWSSLPGIILNNGMFLRFVDYDTNCVATNYYNSPTICGAYEVDVNGFKGPNTIGKDIFFIHVLKDHIRPAGVAESTGGMSATNCGSTGEGCGALYLQQ